jgi:hypothetical protein
MHSVSDDLEFQKQLPTSKGSSRKPLVDGPADEAKMKPPVGCNSIPPRDIRDVLVEASEKTNFDWSDSLPIERMKAGLIEIALAFLLLAGLVTFGLACLLSPTFLA